jgi:hypothetical protein
LPLNLAIINLAMLFFRLRVFVVFALKNVYVRLH